MFVNSGLAPLRFRARLAFWHQVYAALSLVLFDDLHRCVSSRQPYSISHI